MARTNDPDSADSQFFINLADNKSLDYVAGQSRLRGVRPRASGMDVVKAIAKVETGTVSRMDDVPVEPVVIISARRVDEQMRHDTTVVRAAATALFLGAVVTEIHSRLFAGRYFALLVLSVVAHFHRQPRDASHLRAHDSVAEDDAVASATMRH